jgi:hypothetical protein
VQDDVLQREYFKFFWLIGSCHVIGGPAEGVLSSDVAISWWNTGSTVLGGLYSLLSAETEIGSKYIFIYIFCFKY